MNNATGVYLGGYHVECTHQSGAVLDLNPPHGFSPTEVCVTALCACIVMTMGYYGKKHGLDVSGTRFSVTEGYSSALKRVERVDVVFTMPNRPFSPEDKANLERVAQSCPVHNSLHEDIIVDMTFEWPQEVFGEKSLDIDSATM